MPVTTRATKAIRKRRRAATPKIARTHKPPGMTLEQWQVALRRQFGREQKFKLQPLNDEGVFGDYRLTNPQSKRSYRVSIRGQLPGENYCACPDFKVNTLGTCKHIEFVLSRLERRPGGKVALRAGWQPAFTELYLRYGSDRQLLLRLGGDCPADLPARITEFVDEHHVVRHEAFDRFDELLDELRRGDHEVRCHEDAIQFVAQFRDRSQLRDRVARMFPGGSNDPAWDSLLRVKLYPYQRQGALFTAAVGRSLLADDMGLGKTIQSIAAAEILARAAGVERVLIVTPTSLKHQWKREIVNFTGKSAVVIEGGPKARRVAYAAEAFFKITNYETLHLDVDRVQQWAPDLVILDEAQRIKNWKTRTAQTVKQLEAQYAIVLTGTPLENRLEELHSIVEFVDRYRLGPSFRFLAEHQQLDEDGRVVGYRNLGSITKTLEPVLLRRTKNQVLKELPERMDKHFFLTMTSEQKAIHEEYRVIVARLVHRWRTKKYLSEADQRRLTCALQNMRMSCNSTYLIDSETDFGTKVDEIIARLDEVLESPENKVVIFSQWVRSHELLIRRLGKRREFVFLHGGVPGHKRQDLINRFRDDDRCRIFLSTDAGGVGLNLQTASTVFIMDQPWNPAVLEQRIGRVHRLGQTRPVQVLHFVARDTIEHGMLDLIKFKRSLFAGVLDGAQDSVFMGGTRLKKFMDGVEAATTSIPKASGETAAVGDENSPAATGVAAATAITPALAPAQTPAAASAPTTSPEIVPDPTSTGIPVADPPPASPVSPNVTAPTDPYAPLLGMLLEAGKTFIQKFTAQMSSPDSLANPALRIEHDPRTNQPCLKIPIPSTEVFAQFGQLLQTLAQQVAASKP